VRQRGLGACLALLSVVAGACASAPRPSPVVQGRGPVTYAIGTRPAPAGSAWPRPERGRPARRQAASGFTTTIESTDPTLKAALARLALAETPQNHLAVAQAYRALLISDTAYNHMKRALALDPSFAQAHDGLARIWRDWGAPHLGLGEAHRAVHCAPDWAPAHNTLGTLLEAVGDPLAARAAYQQALRVDPGATWAADNLGRLTRQLEAAGAQVRTPLGER